MDDLARSWHDGNCSVPRLPVNRLLELRLVLDRIMVALSSGEIAPTGGFGHEEAEGYDGKVDQSDAEKEPEKPVVSSRPFSLELFDAWFP
jgi:hypothetical protein